MLKFKNLLMRHSKFYQFNLSFLILCAVAGIISALFSLATDYAYRWVMFFFHTYNYLILVYTPLVFILIAYLLKKYFPYSDGSGLPQGYAVDVFKIEQLKHTYSIKTMIGKIILTFMSIASGASLGKEGPTIQICASLFGGIKNISLKRKRLLIKIGSGVGVASAFNAPIGGIAFALEEYIKDCELKINIVLLMGIAIAGLCAIMVSGNYSYLGRVEPKFLIYSWQAVIGSILIGIIFALLGILYIKIMVFVSVDQQWSINRLRRKHFLINAAFMGFLVAVLGLLSHGYSFGNGAVTNYTLLDTNSNAPWYYGTVKFVGSILSVAAGAPGGYFSTALSIGSGFADLLHQLIPCLSLAQFYLLGMVGFLAAITQAPITSAIMVIEISNAQVFSLPIILTAVIASMVSMKFGDSVYHQQVLNYIPLERYHETR